MDQITDQLWITDIRTVCEQPTDRFDHVVTVCQDSVEDNVGCAYTQFKLADGPYAVGRYGGECSYSMFERAASTVLSFLEVGDTVLVHCHNGQSRAPSVSIAALAVYEGLSYVEAYDIVSENRTQTNTDGTLQFYTTRFISENG